MINKIITNLQQRGLQVYAVVTNENDAACEQYIVCVHHDLSPSRAEFAVWATTNGIDTSHGNYFPYHIDELGAAYEMQSSALACVARRALKESTANRVTAKV